MGRLPKGELPLAQQIEIVREVEGLSKELERAPVKRSKDLTYFIESDPTGYKDIVDRLASGESVNKISRLTGHQPALIRDIIKAHPGSIDSRRSAIVDRLEEAIHATSERLAEDNDKISINRLADVLTETVKNFQLLRGEATSRTETKPIATPEELKRMFDSLPKAKTVDNDILSDK